MKSDGHVTNGNTSKYIEKRISSTNHLVNQSTVQGDKMLDENDWDSYNTPLKLYTGCTSGF